MRAILSRANILNRIRVSNRVNRSFCSSSLTNKSTAINNNDGPSSSASLSKYDEQYKALSNLDFMTAAKILFTEPDKKKKFGLDFHLVQLFFVCLPSLAVYLVAQYARSEMKKMDAELERKKQAEFEAQAKEMELKAAEEKAAKASNPELSEVKVRLDKLEVTVNEFIVESKKQPNEALKKVTEDDKHAQKAKGPTPVVNGSQDNPETGKNGKTS